MNDLGVYFFNKDAGSGLAFVVATGCVPDFPIALSLFMERKKCDPDKIGSFLGDSFSLAQTLRLEFLNAIECYDNGVVSLLKTLFTRLQPPPDLQKIDRIFLDLSLVWWKQVQAKVEADNYGDEAHFKEPKKTGSGKNIGERKFVDLFQDLHTPEALYQLLCGCLLLYWNVHSQTKLCRRLEIEEWMALNDGIEDLYGDIDVIGCNVPEPLLCRIYELMISGGLPEIDRCIVARYNGDSYAEILRQVWRTEQSMKEERASNINGLITYGVNTLLGESDTEEIDIDKVILRDNPDEGLADNMNLQFCDQTSKPIDIITLVSTITGNTDFYGSLIFMKKQHFFYHQNGMVLDSTNGGIKDPRDTSSRNKDVSKNAEDGKDSHHQKLPVAEGRSIGGTSLSSTNKKSSEKASSTNQNSEDSENSGYCRRSSVFLGLSSLMAENTTRGENPMVLYENGEPLSARFGTSPLGGPVHQQADNARRKSGHILATFDSMLWEGMAEAQHKKSILPDTYRCFPDLGSLGGSSEGHPLRSVGSELTAGTNPARIARWADIVLAKPLQSTRSAFNVAEISDSPRKSGSRKSSSSKPGSRKSGSQHRDTILDNAAFISLACGLLMMAASPEDAAFAFLNLRDINAENVFARAEDDFSSGNKDASSKTTYYSFVLSKKPCGCQKQPSVNDEDKERKNGIQVVLLFRDGRWDTFFPPVIKLGCESELKRIKWVKKINKVISEGREDRERGQKECDDEGNEKKFLESDTETIC